MNVQIKDRVLHKYEKEHQKLKIGGGSWTINLDKVALWEIDKIVYETNKHIYTIDREKAEKMGWRLKLGDEPKLVVPIKNWEVTDK